MAFLADSVGSAAKAAKDLGILPGLLQRRRRETKRGGIGNPFPARGNPRGKEMAELRKRIADLEETNAILKKALVIFSQDEPRK